MRRFLPPHLQEGAKGPGVLALQIAMKPFLMSYQTAGELVCDGDFGPATTAAVAELQGPNGLEFDEEHCDGKFGPKSQAKFAETFFDLNALPFEAFAGVTTWTDGVEDKGEWTGEMADDPRDAEEESEEEGDEDEEGEEEEEAAAEGDGDDDEGDDEGDGDDDEGDGDDDEGDGATKE